MGRSVEVIRDEDGLFHNPDGCPLVMIFDSKPDECKKPLDEILWQEPVIGLHKHQYTASNPKATTVRPKKAKDTTQPLKFVNTSGSAARKKRPKRSHRSGKPRDCQPLSQDNGSSDYKIDQFISIENAMLCRRTPSSTSSSSEESWSSTMSVPWVPNASIEPFGVFPIEMEPYMYALLHRYLSLTSVSSKTSQLQSRQDQLSHAHGWFPLAMTDAALFHALLCGSALYVDLFTGKKYSMEQSRHMKDAIHLLSTRLQNTGAEISDSTMVAVAHLAEFGTMVGNFSNWKLHMDGLYKMVQMRGGLSMLNDDVRTKICSADITGCIGTLSKPRFFAMTEKPTLPLSLKPPPSPLCSGFINLIEFFALDSKLRGILLETQDLTSILNSQPLDFPTLYVLQTPIQSHLLSYSLQSDGRYEAILEEACRISGLVYLQTLHHFNNLKRTAEGCLAGVLVDGAIARKLKLCIEDMAITNITQTLPFFLWILFQGGVAVAGTKDRAWFVARLVKTAMKMQINSWEHAKATLMEFFWIDRIHDVACRALWDETSVTMDVLFGGR